MATGDHHLKFFVAGVQKGGTTSLFAHLREHPELSPPLTKEVHFFDDETRDWHTPCYADLHAHFSADADARLRFDCTPIYSFWPPSLSRIHNYNPQAKLILLFREPFERAWSHWCMEYARGWERANFAEAIREGRRRMESLEPLARERRIYTYVERGRYAEQVERAISLFPQEQLLFLRSEDFSADHRGTLARIAAFLGIGAFPERPALREHVRPEMQWPALPTLSDRMHVRTELGDQIARFSDYTGVSWDDRPDELATHSNPQFTSNLTRFSAHAVAMPMHPSCSTITTRDKVTGMATKPSHSDHAICRRADGRGSAARGGAARSKSWGLFAVLRRLRKVAD